MTTLQHPTLLQQRAAMPTAGLSLRPDRVALRKLLWAAPLAGLASAAGNLAVFGVARLGLDLSLVMPPIGPFLPSAPLTALQVGLASFAPALVAAVLLAILSKLTARPVLAFQVIAGVFLVLSLVGPLRQPVDLATKLTLLSMHLVAGLAITAVLSTFSADGRK